MSFRFLDFDSLFVFQFGTKKSNGNVVVGVVQRLTQPTHSTEKFRNEPLRNRKRWQRRNVAFSALGRLKSRPLRNMSHCTAT
ncbi:hypothetical protein L596_011378 [Steinernema carpocapsae]|uniref:Uncharacterized protein n=1 Tax=Steinernema carpocapsae TaxID=34508 RepID=A0A4U5NUM9_STECR|nr:hypothetical protein L596_011378 [Steinernema carpocapsae]